MSKFTTTLKGLMALALGSFALSASAEDVAPVTIEGATQILTVPTEAENNAVYIIQSQTRGGLYADASINEVTRCGIINEDANSCLGWRKDVAINADDPNQQFAIITHAGEHYLYSVGTKKFVAFQAIANRTPKGVVVLGTTNMTNAILSAEIATYNGTQGFAFRMGGYSLSHVQGFVASIFKGVAFLNPTVDGGSLFNVQKLNNVTLSDEDLEAALSIIKGPVEQTRTQQLARLNDIRQFYYNKSELDGYIAQVNAASTTSQINDIVNTVFNILDGKMIYLLYAPRENESDYKYLGVIGAGNYRIAQLLPERGTRAKWQLHRVPDTYTFRVYNTASDTYLTAKWNDGQVAVSGSGESFFEIELKNNTAIDNAIALKYKSNFACLTIQNHTIGGTNYPYTLHWTTEDFEKPEVLNNAAYAWKVEPVGTSLVQLASMPADGEYFMIRSNRAMTATPNSDYEETFPGSLVGCYTPDREKARANATAADNGKTYSNGVHIRPFMTGMQTIWKIVRQSDGGYKIYSLMGEDENDAPLLGMTFGSESSSEITITDHPTTVYFIDPVSYNGYNADKKSIIPNGIAISSVNAAEDGKCFHLYNALLGDENGSTSTSDFYVRANFVGPNHDPNRTNQGSVFYIERVSSTDVANAKNSFKDYAKNSRMFELLKNVLTPEEEAYALEHKTSNPENINSVAAARAYLMEGTQAASTRAFEKLDGKIVRFNNRMHSGYYMGSNDAGTYPFCYNTGADNDLSKLWRVEVVNAALRKVKLVNYNTGKYIGAIRNDNNNSYELGKDESSAGEYVMARYYSLDGTKFYMNILSEQGNSRKYNSMHCASSKSYQVVRWTHSAEASHWTMENAVADDVKNTEVTLNYDKENKVIVVSGAALEKTANFPAAYGVTLTPAAATAALDGEAATPVEVAVPNDKITKDGETFKVDLSELNVTPSNYTLNFPVGYFTINNKLAPALSTAVTVSEPTGIKEVNAAEKGAEVIYDLQGRRVSKAGKGVYIINGVKTLVK